MNFLQLSFMILLCMIFLVLAKEGYFSFIGRILDSSIFPPSIHPSQATLTLFLSHFSHVRFYMTKQNSFVRDKLINQIAPL